MFSSIWNSMPCFRWGRLRKKPVARNKKRGDNPPIGGGGFMKGSVQKDIRTGKAYIKLYLDGKQITIHTDKRTNSPLTSEKHANKVLSLIQSEIDDGVFNRNEWKKKRGVEAKRFEKRMTVSRYSNDWLKKRKELCENDQLVPRTVKDEKTHIQKYILPRVGKLALENISKEYTNKLYSNLKLSNSSRYNIVSTFRKMLNDAKEDDLIASVPEFPKMSKKTHSTKRYMKPEDQDKVIEKIPDKDKPIFQVARQYGLRIGEARAIKKSSIRDDELNIEWSFSENYLRNTTKTDVARSYSLTPFIKQVLENIPKNESEFLFVRDDGKPYTSKNLNKIWRKALKDAGVPHLKLYNAMRHSLARNLLENGYGYDMVAEVLGHASVEMTRSFYSDMPMNRIKDALSGLSESQNWIGR